MSTKTIRMPYAVAYERYRGTQVIADIQYVKASEEQEAKMLFLRRCPHIAKEIMRKCAKILAIAPALGYTIDSKDGSLIV